MTKIRKSTLALAVVTACCAIGTASAANSLMTVAHPTYTRQGDALMGTLAQTQQIHFNVALQMRDRAGLDAFIAGMKTHHTAPMTTAQFMALHAPTQAQVNQVVSWMKSQGFSNIVVAPNHLLVSATGNAGQVNRAFNTTMMQFRTHDGRVAFGNTTEAKIPSSLQGNVLGVVGLQNVNVGHTFIKHYHPKPGAHTMAVTGHLPTDFPSIYGAGSTATAAGVTVGIFTQGSMTTTISDLNKFTAAHGFPTVTTQLVNTNGTGTATSGVDEWDLDSQDIVGMGGGQVGKIIWYQTPSLSDADMNANFNTIVSANAAKIINVSIGGCETSSQGATATASDQSFAQGVAQGQTFSISTGDSGADECGNGGTTPSWPANSQYVMAVAGTTLDASTGSSATWNSETVWTSSGGSPSKYEPKPSWQTAALCPGSYRCVADVAFDADPNSGSQLYLSGASPSTSTQVGGTSLAAPLFAGEWARVIATKGTSVGFAAPLIYKLPSSAFHDIVSGNNGGESAAPGFDLASGWGSIILSNMVADLGGTTTTPTANWSDVTSGLTATFTDSSSDVGGTITAHSWTFGDSGTSTATNPSHTYAASGTYSVTETVTDSGGKTASKTNSVTVTAASTGGTPTANFTDTVSGLTAAFTDTSTDSGGTIGSHSWTFGDGGTSTATSPSHTYAAAGTYSVTETVTDSTSGKTSSKTASVTATSGGTPVQLLGNTGFETTGSWTGSSGIFCTNSTCSGETAYAGTGFAWLDGYSSTHTDTLSQTVTIPSGKSSANVQYYLHIDTNETTTTAAYSTLTVALYSGSTKVATLGTYSNLNANTGYTLESNTANISAYAGKKLTLKFTGKQDSTPTSFVLDNVTMTVK